LILDRNQILSNLTELKVEKIDERMSPEMLDTGMFYDIDDGSIPDEVSYVVYHFEDDEFNQLLLVENKIEEMYGIELLTKMEVKLLTLLSRGHSYKEVGEELNIGKASVRKIFHSTSNKIAFALGGVFTDEGYVEYMATKHELTDVEISKMITLMESNRRL
jgi:hypothetical protein